MAIFNQSQKFALAGEHVFDVKAGELNLSRMVDSKLLAVPVVKWSVVLKLKRA